MRLRFVSKVAARIIRQIDRAISYSGRIRYGSGHEAQMRLRSMAIC